MLAKNLSKNTAALLAKTAVAAGTTDIKSDGVDMSNAWGVVFLFAIGTITATAVTSAKLQHSDTDVDGDYVDVAGSACVIAETQSDKLLQLELVNPQKKFVRLYVDRGTANAVINAIIAIKHGLRKAPATAHASIVATGKVLAGPASGTA